MTGMLASVNSVEEALQIEATAVDIIDLKQPAAGALGALTTNTVKQIVARTRGDKPISATIGDLPMKAEVISPAVADMAATGVDYIKIGFFPGGDWPACIQALSRFTTENALIAVLFADNDPDFSILPLLRQTGFAGVMLDTMDKSRGSLIDIMVTARLARFVTQARQLGLLCGLAGSLRRTDVPALLPLNADYLGFRGALCSQHNRTAQLHPQSIAELIDLFKKPVREAVA